MDCIICVAKIKTLVSFAVTAKMICIFVFAYADCWFSGAAAHMNIDAAYNFLQPFFFQLLN